MAYRKLIFLTLLLFFVPNFAPVLSADNRGVKPTSFGLLENANLGNYHALIIGINNYKEWNPLKTAVKDAQALKEVLIQRYGFKKDQLVLRTENEATRLGLIKDLRNLASNLENHDNLLIYYAGHGQLDDLTGDGYWIPIEGKLKDPGTWISHSTIKNILSSERVRGKNIVIVADSCYSGTLLRGGPSLLSLAEEGYHNKLLKLAARRSRQVITSRGLEPVADGGRDGHSLFAYYFLKALKENNRQIIDLENLFHTYVWKPVTEIGDQRPNVGRLKTPMDEDGQFVLLANMERQPSALENINTKLEAEKKRLAAEAAQLERERRELEQMKVLIEQRKKLEAERRRMESEKKTIEENKRKELEIRIKGSEKQKLAYIPKEVQVAKVSLRTEPKTLHARAIRNMIFKYYFFDKELFPVGNFTNDFIVNQDRTITDRATGLIWQKSGSKKVLTPQQATFYVKKLNKESFAGYSDWRLPTIDELASLLINIKTNNLYIDPLFDSQQKTCWSSDKGLSNSEAVWYKGWMASFADGRILPAIRKKIYRESRNRGYKENLETHPENYVRAVRSVK